MREDIRLRAAEPQEIWCPFYRGHTMRSVCCEGITDESVLRLIFRTPDQRVQQMRIFCATDHCTYCELYPAINGRYEDG